MIVFLTNFLLASVALAVPSASQPDTHLSIPRTDGQSHLVNRTELLASAPVTDQGMYYNSSQTAGAIYSIGNSSTFSTVTGTFTVPSLSGADGEVLIGVNIDHYNCKTSGVLRAGIVSWIIHGAVSYSAVMEWYPGPFFMLDMAVHADDEIKTIIHFINATSIRMIIENRTRGQTEKQELTSEHNTLCMHDAGWTLESSPFVNPVPLANFSRVEFTNATAYDSHGTKYIAANAYPFEIVENKTVLASVSVLADTITIQYV